MEQFKFSTGENVMASSLISDELYCCYIICFYMKICVYVYVCYMDI